MPLRKTFPALLLLLAVGLMMAQTSVRIGMISGPVSPGGVMVLAPNGQITFATIGPGILLDKGTGGYVLRVQSANRVLGAKLSWQADGTYLLPQTALPASLLVYRNGVRQSAGDDYTFESATRKIAPVAGYSWDASDLVLVDFEY
jgi:hypothetical protein